MMGTGSTQTWDSQLLAGIEDLELKENVKNGEQLKEKLLQQCGLLLSEIESFENYLEERREDNKVELRHFKNNVKTEFSSLKKLSNADPAAQRTLHALRSSNLPFYAAVWDSVKRCNGVVSLQKRFHWTPENHRISELDPKDDSCSPHKRYNVLVDIVARDGSEWVKVSTLTQKRLLFDMAKAGWMGASFSEDSDEGEDEHDEPEGLLKQAEALMKASRATRVRYRHPEVRIVLPKIKRGSAKEADELIKQVEALGIEVQTGDRIPDAPTISAVLHHLAVDPFADFSDIINVDCTILLALVSDLSHSRVEAEDWHHRAILRQIEMEEESQLLPNSLWPAMGSRLLVCTSEAAKRMHQIVDLIGTKSEKQRRDLLMDVPITAVLSREKRVEAFQQLSAYEVPAQWNIPIKEVDPDIAILQQGLPSSATEVAKLLSSINQSVFLYGWSTDRTTISSNRTVAKEIESTVEKYRLADDDVGPQIWLCPTARSLVGKEKQRRNWDK